VQDINLTFLQPYPIDLVKGSGQTSGTTFNRSSPTFNEQFNNQNNQTLQQPCPPGIPCDKLQRYPTPQPQKKDEDVDDEDGDN
jgi:hypothetical protein